MFNLSQWNTTAAGVGHYDRTPGGGSYAIGGDRLRWDGSPTVTPSRPSCIDGLRWGIDRLRRPTVAERDARAGTIHMRLVGTVRSFS